MKRLFLSLALCFAHTVFGYDSSSPSRVHGIDFIYMINLDKRPEKFEKSLSQLRPYGIHPFRFSAVYGWNLSLEKINELGVKLEQGMDTGKWGTYYPLDGQGNPQHEIVTNFGRTYFSHCMSRGAIGIVLSHLGVLKHAYNAGYETIWVMEDDIEVFKNPHVMGEYIKKLDARIGKKGWDILFTDKDTRRNSDGAYVECTAAAWRPNFRPQNPSRFSKRSVISSEFRRIGARYGAYSMIVRRSGMKKLIDFFDTYHIFLPFDMEFFVPNDIQLFTVLNDVVGSLLNAESDNGAERI